MERDTRTGSMRRSREGAWIEMQAVKSNSSPTSVAPARERGLKFKWTRAKLTEHRRSREGAWIEIGLRIAKKPTKIVAPARERGLK